MSVVAIGAVAAPFDRDVEAGFARIARILDDDAAMNESVPPAYRGLDRFAARRKVVEDMQALGLVEKVEDQLDEQG